MIDFSFFVPGTPAPGGSKRAFVVTDKKTGQPIRAKLTGRIIVNMTDDAGQRNKDWRAKCTVYARQFMKGAKPFTGAIKVQFIFYMRRPLSHFRSGKNSHMLKTDAPRYHVVKPDALKLARSTEDALTGVLWNDDAANTKVCTEKVYCGTNDKEGCAVRFIILPSEPIPAVTPPAGM